MTSGHFYLVITIGVCLGPVCTCLLMSGFFWRRCDFIFNILPGCRSMVLDGCRLMMLQPAFRYLERRGEQPALLGAGRRRRVVLVFRIAGLFSIGDGSPPASESFGTIEAVGASLFSTYLLPFELAAVLLLIAVIGAVILAKRTTS